MSAMGQKRKLRPFTAMSVLPPKPTQDRTQLMFAKCQKRSSVALPFSLRIHPPRPTHSECDAADQDTRGRHAELLSRTLRLFTISGLGIASRLMTLSYFVSR